MAGYLNILMRRFSNTRMVEVGGLSAVVEFVGWRTFRVFATDGKVLEIIGGADYSTKCSQWLSSILRGAVRDDDGVVGE